MAPSRAASLLRWAPNIRPVRTVCHPGVVRPLWTSHASQSNSTSPISSVNPDEISHFNALASTWWDPHGSSRLLHLMNPLRHDFIQACHASQPDALLPGS